MWLVVWTEAKVRTEGGKRGERQREGEIVLKPFKCPPEGSRGCQSCGAPQHQLPACVWGILLCTCLRRSVFICPFVRRPHLRRIIALEGSELWSIMRVLTHRPILSAGRCKPAQPRVDLDNTFQSEIQLCHREDEELHYHSHSPLYLLSLRAKWMWRGLDQPDTVTQRALLFPHIIFFKATLKKETIIDHIGCD